jgi:predicted nuclease of predicted toxin-antitoxin system
MRFLATENFPRVAVAALEAAGHGVVWKRTAAPGASDVDVLKMAARGARILLTYDKDFRELAGRTALPDTCGVVLVRLRPSRSSDDGRALAALIASREHWVGSFSVIEPGRIRMRARNR